RRRGAPFRVRATAERRRVPVRGGELYFRRWPASGRIGSNSRCSCGAYAYSAAGRPRSGGGCGSRLNQEAEEAMNRRVLLVLLACSATGFAAGPLPSAESILDRYVQVTGGKQAYEKRKSEIAHGTVEFPALGIKGSVTRYAAQPDKYYYIVDIAAIGKMQTGVNGSIAWENSAIL